MQHKRGCATDGVLANALFPAPAVLPSVVMVEQSTGQFWGAEGLHS